LPVWQAAIELAEGVSRQLRAWADSLQNSKISGQRHLTEKTRRAETIRKDISYKARADS
jgi:hypothetical protein